MASIMQMTVCIALSLYSCCLKENLTTLYSHIFTGICILCALGTTIGLEPEHYIFCLVSCVFVSIWASFVIHNLIAIHKQLKKETSFYAALTVQTDLTILLKAHCIKKRLAKDEQEQQP